MRYYPSLEYDERITFDGSKLKSAIIERSHKVRDFRFQISVMKRKVSLVLEVPINEQEPVYMDVLTGEVFDTYETVQNYPNRKLYTDGYVLELSEDYLQLEDPILSQERILRILYQIHQECRQKARLNLYPYEYIKNDGRDLICYELDPQDIDTLDDRLLTAECVSELIEEDVQMLRQIVENKFHKETRDLYLAKHINGDNLVVYPAIFWGYHDYVTNPSCIAFKGEVKTSELRSIKPFYQEFVGQKIYPVLTPSLAYQLMRDHLEEQLKKQKVIR